MLTSDMENPVQRLKANEKIKSMWLRECSLSLWVEFLVGAGSVTNAK